MVIRQYGPPYDLQKPLDAQPELEAHRAVMNALEANGLARLAGPVEGTAEALLVFRAENKDEIDQRVRGDPWTQSGILSTAWILRRHLRLGEVL